MSSVTRRRSGSPDRRGAIEQRVLAAVEELLGEGYSFTELPVVQIAERAGIARSSFYVYFPDKTDLVLRLAEQAITGLMDEAERWFQGDHHDGFDGILGTIERMIVEFRAHHTVLRALVEVASYEPRTAKFWQAQIADWVGRVAPRVDAQRAAGRAAPDFDIHRTVAYLAHMTEQAITGHIADGRHDDTELARVIARLIWLGIYGDAEHPPNETNPRSKKQGRPSLGSS